MNKLQAMFLEPRIIGLVGNANTGKSNLLYYLLDNLNKSFQFKTYAYGLRKQVMGVEDVYSVPELEQIRDSIIIIDEMSSLFDLDNRKNKQQVENMIRLIYHNNNVLVLCGLGENFKKFISSKLDIIFYKKVLLADLINGSSVKNHLMSYRGYEKGSTVLNLGKGEAIVYDGGYHKIKVPYMKEYDTKKNNKNILTTKRAVIVPEEVSRNVPKNVEKMW